MGTRVEVIVAAEDEAPSFVLVSGPGEDREIGVSRARIEGGAIVWDVGAGELSALTSEKLRRIGSGLIRRSDVSGSVRLDVSAITGFGVEKLAQALTEGLLLGGYRFDRYRTSSSLPQPSARARVTVALVGSPQDREALQAGIDRAVTLCDSVMVVRDLVNEPPSVMTPRRFVEMAEEIASSQQLEVRVWDENDAAREGLGGLLGVARGSNEPPRMLRLHYVPRDGGQGPKIGLVGKGITFDSGGLSLKSGTGMMAMKGDMAGAAIVLGTMAALSKLGVRAEVYGYMALTENLPSGSAQKPGDVLTARNGKTIEVLNTDAEGRLVLADALSLAVEDGCDQIVDIATLTGAKVVALGSEIGAIMGTSDELMTELRQIGDETGEEFWPLPLPDRYKKHIASDIADMKNIGKAGEAGAIAAGLLLREFVGAASWAHLDVAGSELTDSVDGYSGPGATGFGVRTLATWLATRR